MFASPIAPVDQRRWYDSARGVWAMWAVFALLSLVVLILPEYDPFDPDAYLRLQEVRDLLAGQSWFDVTQYRMNPPGGASMHWSRLVDVPIAGLIMLFGLVMPPSLAEYWACAMIPLLYMGATLFLLRAIMLRLGLDERRVLIGLGLLLLFPLVPHAYAPMAIDHHVPQAVAALVAALMFLQSGSRRAAIIGGIACAAWLVISLEGLPIVAVLAALYGLRYVLTTERSLPWFLASLAAASSGLSLATRPPLEFLSWCDVLLPAHWAAFGVGALVAFALPYLPRQHEWRWRMAALGLLPLICGPLAFALLGRCATDPFAALDPVTRSFWFAYVQEGAPFWKQPFDSALMVLWLPVTILAGLYAAFRRGLMVEERRIDWLLYACLTLMAALYGFWLFRASLIAQLLAAPFAAMAMAHFLPSARAIKGTGARVLATVACLLFVTPLGATSVGAQLKSAFPSGKSAAPSIALGPLAPCDFAALNALPQGHVFNTLDSAAEVLVRTHHTAQVGGYHRNSAEMRKVILGFRSDPAQARTIIAASGANYLAVCLEEDSMQIFGRDRPDSLAQAILRDEAPAWLEPHPDFVESRLRVYIVR